MSAYLLAYRLQVVLLAMFLLSVPAWGKKLSQVEPNHMRWKNHEVVLANAIAWQEERDGHWVTIVLLTDKPVPRQLLTPEKGATDLMQEIKTHGVAVAIMSGGVPLEYNKFDVGYHDGTKIGTSSVNGAGGFEIETQSATQIKGHIYFNAYTTSTKDENAWSVSFDAPVLRGDAKRMANEGEALGANGGQPVKDMLIAQQAIREMDYETLVAYLSPDRASFLQDPTTREKNLKILKTMASPQSKILGGLRNEDKARVYWVQQRPDGLDNRCVDTLILQDGKWRSTETVCQAE